MNFVAQLGFRTELLWYRIKEKRVMKNKNLHKIDDGIIGWFYKWFRPVSRMSLFVVYFWFGFLKLVGLSPASPLAEALTVKTIGEQWFNELFAVLAVLECIIGILFLIPRATRLAIAMMLLHMLLVCSPLVLTPELVWRYPFVPTLEGQYIIKNIALLAVAITLASNIVPYSKKS